MKIPSLSVRVLMLIALTGPCRLYAAEMPAPMQPEEIKWGAAPPVLPGGAKMAVLAGDPAGTGLVTVRQHARAGDWIPLHWHPTDEHVMLISGALAIGIGRYLRHEAPEDT
jgi:hypothetical protein